MSRFITIHADVDVNIRDLCADVVDDSEESELISELADAITRQLEKSTNEREIKFRDGAVARLREVAKWVEANQP